MNNIKHIVTITPDEGPWSQPNTFAVQTVVEGIEADQTNLVGFIVRGLPLANRLKRAIEAGAVFHDHFVGTNVHGKTYVHAPSRVMAKYANADLKRLGY